MHTRSLSQLFGLATLVLIGTLGTDGEWFGLANPELSTFFLNWNLGFPALLFLEA